MTKFEERRSAQRYTFSESAGRNYSCGINSNNNVLKTVSSDCNQTIKFIK